MEKIFIAQLKSVIDEHEAAVYNSERPDASDVLSVSDAARLQTRALAAIERVVGKNSVYYEQAERRIVEEKSYTHGILQNIIGDAKSLLLDLENGCLKTFAEILHSDLFSDYLEMAQHLLQNGYKDAAAVITGSTLEAHLKQLAVKHGVDTETDSGRPKKADTLNADLVKVNAFSKLDQKNITAWLDLRNKAAHGEYSEYGKEQVELMSENVRNFIIRVPA